MGICNLAQRAKLQRINCKQEKRMNERKKKHAHTQERPGAFLLSRRSDGGFSFLLLVLHLPIELKEQKERSITQRPSSTSQLLVYLFYSN